MSMKQELVIYHANCADGFASAFAAWLSWRDEAIYRPCNYGNDQAKLVEEARNGAFANYDITFVDFSLPRAMLIEFSKHVHSVTVLDHHKTAQEDLAGDWSAYTKIAILFDMNKAGCQLAWEHYHGEAEMPLWMQLVAMRDLYQHKGTDQEKYAEQIHAAITAAPFDFTLWDSHYTFHYLVNRGEAILGYFNNQLDRIQKNAFPLIDWMGRPLLAVNADVVAYSSELGYRLSTDSIYVMVFSIGMDDKNDYSKEQQAYLSFRSKGDLDVSAVAKAFGGGGHKNAAGAKIPLRELDLYFQQEWRVQRG